MGQPIIVFSFPSRIFAHFFYLSRSVGKKVWGKKFNSGSDIKVHQIRTPSEVTTGPPLRGSTAVVGGSVN